MKKLLFGLLSCLLVGPASAQQGPELVKVTDLLKIKQIGGVTLTRDGRKAAFTVLSIVPDEKNKADYKNVSQLYVVGTEAGAQPRQLTAAKEGASQPEWSPDGRQLAFVRTVDEKPQVFVMAADGGEGRQLTRYKHGASNPRWSPDGRQLLFSSAIPLRELLKDSLLNAAKRLPRWPFEKPGFDKNDQLAATVAKPNADGNLAEIRAYLDKNETDKKSKVLTKLNFQDERDVSAEQTFSQFFVIDATAPDAQPVALTNGFYRFNQAAFTPDGKHLLLSADIDSLQHPDRSLENEIYLADRDGRRPRLLLGKDNVTYTNPVVSPSGKWLAFQMAPALGVDVPVLAVMPLNGTEKDIITIPFDRSKGGLAWSDDDRYLYFTAQSNGGAPLYRATIKTRKVDRLSAPDTGVLSFDVAKNKVVLAQTGVLNPSELLVADASLK